MIERMIGTKRIELYDSTDELPMPRYHKFNKYLLFESGIGSTREDVDQHIMALSQMIHRDDKLNAHQELLNMRQNLYFMVDDFHPKSLAFAVMIKSINGKPCDDISEFGLTKTLAKLSQHGLAFGLIKATVEFLKKKLRRRLKSVSRKSGKV